MRRQSDFAIDEYYHLYNRGTEKRDIFLKESDYERFLVLLHLANNTEVVHISNLTYQGRSLMKLLEIQVPERLVSLGAYCLMPNHFHLLVKEKMENGISLFMKKLLTGYSMFFNKKYERSGNLFQGRFRNQHADTDQYLKYLSAYIHLNPLKMMRTNWRNEISRSVLDMGKAIDFLGNYRYSSYAEHCTKQERPQAVLLDKSAFPEYFGTKQEALSDLSDFIKVGP